MVRKRLLLIVGGTTVLAALVIAAASWLLAPPNLSDRDAELLRAAEQEDAANLVPPGTRLVNSSSVAPCFDYDSRGHVVRVFDSNVSTVSVFEDVTGRLRDDGWQMISTAIAPESRFAGEAIFGKSIDGVDMKLRLLSLIEDTAYTDRYRRPDDYNLEINISFESVDC